MHSLRIKNIIGVASNPLISYHLDSLTIYLHFHASNEGIVIVFYSNNLSSLAKPLHLKSKTINVPSKNPVTTATEYLLLLRPFVVSSFIHSRSMLTAFHLVTELSSLAVGQTQCLKSSVNSTLTPHFRSYPSARNRPIRIVLKSQCHQDYQVPIRPVLEEESGLIVTVRIPSPPFSVWRHLLCHIVRL